MGQETHFLFNAVTGETIALQGRIITIGASPQSTIRLDDPFPSHIAHCLFASGAHYFQVLTKECKVTINTIPVQKKYKLSKGDTIQIGPVTFLYDTTADISVDKKGTPDFSSELIEMVLQLLRNRDKDISVHLMTAISTLLQCDAARIVSEDTETQKRYTLVRYPFDAGLDRFSNRAIDWARDASKTVLMLSPDWVDSEGENRSLEKNAVSSVLCAPLRYGSTGIGYLYLDRIGNSPVFTEDDLSLCDRLIPLCNELLANAEERLRQTEIIATLQRAQEKNDGGIIYRSEKMQEVLNLADRIAPSDAPVLILGETGTGKELMASHIHSKSLRSAKPFKAINCGAIPENLIESELFGHEKGAFTGAHARKTGLFEAAEGGTVFLDELGEMPVTLQTRLLRVLQESEIVRVGGTDVIRINVRIIAATNRDLQKDIINGRFRQDLFFRLNVLTITVPPLRDRCDDIVLLATYFITRFCNRMGTAQKVLSNEARQKLITHSWPGNVRELENVIQKAVVLSGSTKIGVDTIDITVPDTNDVNSQNVNIPTLHDAREAAEKDVITKALKASLGNISQTSRILDIDRKWLITKMNDYGIDADRYR
ncbi:MAG: sigma-54-dependent Fis family transcriptional regulator [Fibrobacter sp.]|nr:sigma-54-dependent Fis family transcriptional regulator [Fibrobacter sp.]